MTIQNTGYGAGTSDFGIPNLLRLFVGEAEPESDIPPRKVSIVETNIDDMNPEFYDSVFAGLFEAGALDVFLSPIQMKKNRPAVLLSAICPSELTDEIARIILTSTTSFGVRISSAERRCLDRRWETVSTPYGDIRVKVGILAGDEITASPEYEDCRKAAQTHNTPVRKVYDSAISTYRTT
jgi:hypothetical protein